MGAKSSAAIGRRGRIKYSKRPAYRRANASNRGDSLAEMVITQCIVCGIILSIVMLICIIKTPPTMALRENIRLALVSNMDSAEPAENMADITSGIYKSVKNIFSPEKKQAAEEIQIQAEEDIPVFYTREKDFRIDEDIMKSIYGGTLNEYNGEIKNSEAPQD